MNFNFVFLLPEFENEMEEIIDTRRKAIVTTTKIEIDHLFILYCIVFFKKIIRFKV